MDQSIRENVIELASIGYEKNGFFNEHEFIRDVRVVFVIKKMINRFIREGVINDRLLMNNIVILINVFGIVRTNLLLRMVATDEQFSVVRSFLQFLDSYRLTTDPTPSNRVIDDMLKDVKLRYALDV